MKGDFILQARVELLGPGRGCRTASWAGWCAARWTRTRPTPTPSVHGDGLTSLQYRRTKGGGHRARSSPRSRARTSLQLERKGNAYTFSAARFGEPFTVSRLADLALGDEVYVGLFLCSHNPDVVETGDLPRRARHPSGARGLRSLSRLHRQRARDPRRGHRPPPGRAPLGPALRGPELDEGRQRPHLQQQRQLRGPRAVSSASTWPVAAAGAHRHRLRRSATTTTTCLSFDGTHARASATRARATGVRRSTPSPSAAGRRSGSRRWRRPTSTAGRRTGSTSSTPAGGATNTTSTGSRPTAAAPEERLTDFKGLDDGPEYSPDGRYIYFNSVRSGTMQIWRMKADGKDPEQITSDELQQLVPAPLARRPLDRAAQLLQGRRAPRTIRTTSTSICG